MPNTVPSASMDKNIKPIAVAVLQRGEHFWVQERQAHQVMAGFWEFPGGKLEVGESYAHALVREIREELGVEVLTYRPLIQLYHDYDHAAVQVQVFLVTHWQGEVHAAEGQNGRWATLAELMQLPFLPANEAIFKALQLPN